VVNEIDFTDNVVEIGLGITTDWLRRRFTRLTVVEIDYRLACLVQTRPRNTNVRVEQSNSTELRSKDRGFYGKFVVSSDPAGCLPERTTWGVGQRYLRLF